ncbi:MAG TPA: PUA domain-containing protein, partial [Desulfobacteria bacterium]|nr:PUA domain-containing protein [Desulfobacteria bacterium]
TVEEITELTSNGRLNQFIKSINEVLQLKEVLVHDNVGKSVSHGNRVYSAGVINMPENLDENQIVKLINTENQCLAAAKVIIDGNTAETDMEHRKYMFQPIKVLF